MLKIVDGRFYLVHGDDGSFKVNPKVRDPETGDLIPYEMKAGDKLILTVRALPTNESPVLLCSTAIGTDEIFITHEQSSQIECGIYSAEIDMIYENGMRDTVWTPDITARNRTKVKSFENFHVVVEVPTPPEV